MLAPPVQQKRGLDGTQKRDNTSWRCQSLKHTNPLEPKKRNSKMTFPSSTTRLLALLLLAFWQSANGFVLHRPRLSSSSSSSSSTTNSKRWMVDTRRAGNGRVLTIASPEDFLNFLKKDNQLCVIKYVHLLLVILLRLLCVSFITHFSLLFAQIPCRLV